MKTRTNIFRQLRDRHLITSRLLLLGLLCLLVSFKSFVQITFKSDAILNISEDTFIYEDKIHVSEGTLVYNFSLIYLENQKRKLAEDFNVRNIVQKNRQLNKSKKQKAKLKKASGKVIPRMYVLKTTTNPLYPSYNTIHKNGISNLQHNQKIFPIGALLSTTHATTFLVRNRIYSKYKSFFFKNLKETYSIRPPPFLK